MLEVEQVSPSVWAHTKGETIGNVAFIKLDESVVMIDSGMDPVTANTLRETVEQISGLPVAYLVYTHYHNDHVFGGQVFTDCKIIATKKTGELIAHAKKNVWTHDFLSHAAKFNPGMADKWVNLDITLPNVTFEKKFTIAECGHAVHLIETGGHTAGCCFVHFPEERVVISGDLVFAESWPYGGDPTCDPFTWLKTFETLAAMDFDKLVPGHGPVIQKNDLIFYLEFFEKILSTIEGFIHKGLDKKAVLEHPELPSLPFPQNEWVIKNRPVTISRFYDAILGRGLQRQ
ncbi:MAG: MBL fold metallo-hydrolase [Candidatus Ranarchaeia archaeon]